MESGSKYKDYTGAVDCFLSKCFKDTEQERRSMAGSGTAMTFADHFKLNAKTSLFTLKLQASIENNDALKELIPLLEQRMGQLFDMKY